MATFRKHIKLVLFLSSYIPLFVILALEMGSTQPLLGEGLVIPLIGYTFDFSWFSALILISSSSLGAILYWIIYFHSGHKTDQIRLDKYQQKNELMSSYLLVYIFVFVGLDFTKLGDWIVFLTFFIMLAALQINSEILHINPMLGFLGYRVYEVTSRDRTVLVISESRLEKSIITHDTQTNDNEKEYRNVEIIPLGPSTYLTPLNND